MIEFAPIGEDDLQAYVDGRLSEARRALVAAYLDENPEAAANVETERQHRQQLRGQLQPRFDEPIPPRLRVASIRAAARVQAERRLWRASAAVFLVGVGAFSGWTFAQWGNGASELRMVTRQAVSAYRTFVVEKLHPVEVSASQEAHLTQWLSKRLGHPIHAPDLAAYGYRLVGGRLLPADAGVAAQFMYENAAGQRLTLYVSSGSAGDAAFQMSKTGEATTFAWIDAGLGYAVTAPLDRTSLLPIAEAVFHALETTGQG